MALTGMQFRIAKARAKRKSKKKLQEEDATLRAVARARRREGEAQRVAELTKQRSTASAKLATAEEGLAQEKRQAAITLRKKRAAKRTRIMSERELRREQIQPILDVPKKIASGLRAASAKMQKIQRATSTTTVAGPGIDLGIKIGDFEQLKKDLKITL